MDLVLDVDAGRSARDGRAVGRGMNRFAGKVRPDIEREQGGGRRRSAAVGSSRNLDAEDRPRMCAPPSAGGQNSAYQPRGK
jgi:hypothetical protein